FDGLEDRKRVVLRVIYKVIAYKRPNHNGRHARTISPDTVAGWRRNVIPTASVFVISYNDQRVPPVVAVADRVYDIGDVLLTLLKVGIARVLVVGTEGLDEADGR